MKQNTRFALVAAAMVGTAAIALVVLLPSSEERSARHDAAAVGGAIAEYVAGQDILPRVTVTVIETNGHASWGEDFLIESRHVPRADPSRARGFFIAGDVDQWCVEMAYEVSRFLLDSSPPEYVAAKGEHGKVGKVSAGRCGGDYVLTLSPVDEFDVPAPGSLVHGATAPIGTCFADPFNPEGGVPAAKVEVVSCETDHFGEVFHSGESNAAEFAHYEEDVAMSCTSAFPAFIGVPYNISQFTFEYFVVGESQWQSGERTFSCFLFMPGFGWPPDFRYPLIGTADDSWR